MLRTLRVTAALLLALAPAWAWPCSLIDRPTALELLSGPVARVVDAGSDATPPGKPVLTAPGVTLMRNPCDGRGAACPQLDWFQVEIAVSDDQTPVERLRYVAAFGATADAATRAEPEVLFFSDRDSPTRISSWLGLGGTRSGRAFDRAQLCFTVAAADEAGNVGPRSDPLCLDTTDAAAPTSTVVQGAPCVLGCGGCTGTGAAAPLALLAAALLRRRRR